MAIFVGDFEADDLLEDVTKIHCGVFSEQDGDRTFCFCNVDELTKGYADSLRSEGVVLCGFDKLKGFLAWEEVTGIVIHNGYRYDFPLLEKFGYIDDIFIDELNGRKCYLIDSLVMSRTLVPDRRLPKGCPSSVYNEVTGRMDSVGPHSLMAWAYRTGGVKPVISDWRGLHIDEYVNRCWEDVKNNKLAYDMMKKEMAAVPIPNGKKVGDWVKPLKLTLDSEYLMAEQALDGALADGDLMLSLVDRIDKEMAILEERVNAELPERVLSASKQPKVPSSMWKKTFPAEPFTKAGKLSAAAKRYCESIGKTSPEGMEEEVGRVLSGGNPVATPSSLTAAAFSYCKKFGIEGEESVHKEMTRLACGGDPKVLTEPMTIKNDADIKEFLVKQGWKPLYFKLKNITVNAKKIPFTQEEIDEKAKRYCEEVVTSPYRTFIWQELGYKRKPDYRSPGFLKKVLRNARGLPTTPQFRGLDKKMCPNLEKMDIPIAKDILLWMSYKNRRGVLKSLDPKKCDTHGWVNNRMFKETGRLPGASSGITPTHRKKHTVIANIPKNDPKVLLGKEMRSVFIAPEGYVNIGCDACGIEARCTGCIAYPFDNGALAETLLEGDVHELNAAAYSKVVGREVGRSEGKSPSYAMPYGAQGAKIGKIFGVSEALGSAMVDAYWDARPGLVAARDAMTKYWELTGKKYIMGLDGRKLHVRSKHSILNLRAQGMASVIMDYAGVWCAKKIREEGLDAQRWLFMHDEYQYYHKESDVIVEILDNEPPQERDGRQWSKPVQMEDGRWRQCYSRVGELIAMGIEEAGRYYELPLDFPGEYMVGKSWAECH